MMEMKHVSVSLGDLSVLSNVSMQFGSGKITVVLGPSGCGKTTILNLLTAMIPRYEGEIKGIDKRKFSYLFQEPRLLPWLTVEGNLRFVLDEEPSEEKRAGLCSRVLAMTGLSECATWYPSQLSGGMKQRVAIARAFAHPSEVILMDEPFQGLDIKRKMSLISQFTALWEEERRTVIMVTHDIGEAIRMADQVYVLTEKPAGLADSFAIDIPRKERLPGSEEYSRLESRLYQLLA